MWLRKTFMVLAFVLYVAIVVTVVLFTSWSRTESTVVVAVATLALWACVMPRPN